MTQPLALALSLAFELPVVLLLGRAWGIPWKRLLLLGAAATLLSHPFAWNSFQWLQPHLSWNLRALIVESGVVLFEALLYWRMTPLAPSRALLASAAANSCSFGLGLVVSRWLMPLLGS